jgi:phosphoribosylformylglycinamidine synthase
VDAVKALALYRDLNTAMRKGLVRSCHDCSDGGLGVALAETAFAGELGMSVDLRQVPVKDTLADDVLLFSETQSRFVVTVSPEHAASFEEGLASSVCARVGVVIADELLSIIGMQGECVVQATIAELKKSWQQPLCW